MSRPFTVRIPSGFAARRPTITTQGSTSRYRQPLFAAFEAAILLVCAGCLVGPNYKPPQEQVPNHYGPSTQPAQIPSTQPSSEELARWWTTLGDPALDALIRRAVEGNLDLAILAERVVQARYQRDVVAGGLWPFLDLFSGGPGHTPLYQRVSGTLDRAHVSNRPRGSVYGRQSVDATGLTGPPELYLTSPGRHPVNVLITPTAAGPRFNIRPPLVSPNPSDNVVNTDELTYEVGLDAIWELDVFGGIRRAIEAATADLQAVQEAHNDLLVMLIADVGRTYIDIRSFQQRIDIAERNIAIQRRTVHLVQTRLLNGLTSDLDMALAQRQLASTEAVVPALRAALEDAQHRMSVLLGTTPEDLLPELRETAAFAAPPPEVPLGLPSELLQQRPDIRRAERQLAAATAGIGVATAALFPRFTLTGSFGLQTGEIRRMLDARSMVWSAGPGINWPIFQGGQLISNVHVQEARAQEALLNYRRVLLIALQEVEDALSNYTNQRQRYLKLLEAVDASSRAARLARDRYDKGLADFLNVLDAERALYDLEDQAAASQQEVLVQLVAIYRALGRGWQAYMAPASASTQPAAHSAT